jgi:hypothetical protein
MARRETEMVREKARHMTLGELANEIRRVKNAMPVAGSKGAYARYERRLRILNDEADRRIAAAGGAR